MDFYKNIDFNIIKFINQVFILQNKILSFFVRFNCAMTNISVLIVCALKCIPTVE